MTRAELVEEIKEKSPLEQYRAANPRTGDSELKALEGKIGELETALSANTPKRADRTVYSSGG